ncbi:MAG: sodium:proton antiporter [Bacteroides sp. SM23_62_1]|nr:MAG: sodium:proton antiporter [Bacteroides sp. SM23_62_1]
MSITPEQVLKVLKRVKHPEKKQDIVALNMVSDLVVQDDKISFNLVFQRSNDPFISPIRKAATKAIKAYISKQAKVDIHVKAFQMIEKEEILPGVKNIIAIASGKGGVGKSTVAANLAVAFALKGTRTGLIDADIFGPSIPKMLGAENRRPSVVNRDNKDYIVPVDSYGVKMLSIGFFVDPNDPVIWRGPMASNALRQFIDQTDWDELDYLFIDLPPGTSDIHLTMVQEIPITGAVIVSTPQKVAIADAIKGVNMFRSQQINVPVLGLIENMSWFTPAELPNNKYFIFGKDGCMELAGRLNIPLLGQIPLVQSICEDSDSGNPSVLKQESIVGKAFMQLANRLIVEINERNKNLPPTKIVEIKK